MDAELKQHLQGIEGRITSMEVRLNANAEAMEGRINANIQHVVTLVTDVKESLEREMNTRFNEVNHRFDAVDARFDAQANRLDRQAAIIQNGARWSARMTAWSEKIDVALDTKSKEIIDLNKRIDKKKDGAE